jgi:transposase-like protein
MEQKEYGKISLAPECPECGSSNVFDLGSKCECEDCGETWTKKG